VAKAPERSAANGPGGRPVLHAVARCVLLVLLALPPGGCGPDTAPPLAAVPGGWHEFQGSWTAAGRRKVLQLGPERRVAVLDVSGSLVLSGPERPALGFLGEALNFADDLTGSLGRAVWTDERGDQVFSELAGERHGERLLVTGTFVGGTGRYAGATGEYAFEWQYLIESEDGLVQGRTLGLAGRVRVNGGPDAEPPR
jgi:hypothetical protein